MTAAINEILDGYAMPQGYEAQTAGSYEDMMESFADLGFALVVALLLVYFVLAVQFESFAMPVMVIAVVIAVIAAAVVLMLKRRNKKE